MLLSGAVVAGAATLAGFGTAVRADDAPAAGVVTYDQVRAVLKKHCTTCHNSERPRGDLDLSTIDAIRSGSGAGAVAVAGRPEESPLYTMPAHLEEPFMPPNSAKIPQRELDLLYGWILGGMQEKKGDAGKSDPAKKPMTERAAATPARQWVAPEIAPLPRATAITALAVSPVVPLAAVSGQGQAILLSLDERKPLRAIDFPDGDVTALKFSRDGRLLLIGGGVAARSGHVIGVDVASGKTLFQVGDESDVVLAVDITGDNRLVALAGPGRSVKVFRTADGVQTAVLRKHTDWILSVAFSPDGLLLASGDRFGGIQVWEAESGEPMHTLRGHVGPVFQVAWSADSDRLLSAGEDGTVRWWEMHCGAELAAVNTGGGVLAAAILPKERILCGGRQPRLTVWDAEGNRVAEFSTSAAIARLETTPDGRFAVVGDSAGVVSLFDLNSNSGPVAIPLPVDASLSRRTASVSAKRIPPLPNPASVADASASAGGDGLATARKAAAQADAAVKSAEEALARARETARLLKEIVREREAAAARGKRSGQ
jgi:WD40 repeat protein